MKRQEAAEMLRIIKRTCDHARLVMEGDPLLPGWTDRTGDYQKDINSIEQGAHILLKDYVENGMKPP